MKNKMNLIKKLGFASLLGGAMLFSNPSKGTLVDSSPYSLKEVKIEIFDVGTKKPYPTTIKDFDDDGIIDEVIIYDFKGKGKWISLRNEFNSREHKDKSNHKFLRNFDLYSCSKEGCKKMAWPHDVTKYQERFEKDNISF